MQNAQSMTSLSMLDISELSILKPAKVWTMACLNKTEVRKAAIASQKWA
jgi:hypothetical protein